MPTSASDADPRVISGNPGAVAVSPTILSASASAGSMRLTPANVTQSMVAISALPLATASIEARWPPVSTVPPKNRPSTASGATAARKLL